MILLWSDKEPVIPHSHDGITQGELLYMVLYGITLVILTEDLQAVDLDLLALLYADDANFDGSAHQSA